MKLCIPWRITHNAYIAVYSTGIVRDFFTVSIVVRRQSSEFLIIRRVIYAYIWFVHSIDRRTSLLPSSVGPLIVIIIVMDSDKGTVTLVRKYVPKVSFPANEVFICILYDLVSEYSEPMWRLMSGWEWTDSLWILLSCFASRTTAVAVDASHLQATA